MNTKVLASLGVLVALMSAWLFVALYTASSVQIQEVSPSVEVEAYAPALDALGEGESMGVSTSVNVANQDVTTSVRVAE